MNTDSRAAAYDIRASESADELIGVLTAISVIAKRMARKLSAMEQNRAMAGGEKDSGKPSKCHSHAD